jgi:hypothetical protein
VRPQCPDPGQLERETQVQGPMGNLHLRGHSLWPGTWEGREGCSCNTGGRSHPAYNMLSQPCNDDELCGKTPEDEAICRADERTTSFRAHAVEDGVNRFLNLACATYYPKFGAPRNLASAIASAEFEATQPGVLLAAAQEAERELKMLETQLERLRYKHENRNGVQKLQFLNDHPTLKEHVPAIKGLAKMYRKQEDDARKKLGIDRQNEHRYQKYNNVSNFVGLIWLRDYLLHQLGVISVQNVKRFELLRMLKNENSSQAYAHVKREAELLQRVGVTD